MGTKKSEPKNLEEKLKNLTEQLERERGERKRLEQKLNEQPLIFSFQFVSKKINEVVHKFNLLINRKNPAQEKQKVVASVSSSRSVLDESVSDDLATYKIKLKSYNKEQLEDIFVNINRTAHKDRFSAVVDELKTRL